MREQPFLIGGATWLQVWDGNPTAAALYDRHYSRNPGSRGDPRIAGPVCSRWCHQLRRAPARACRLDRARWKRRRFVQALRRSS